MLSVLLATITQCKVASGIFVMLASAVHSVAKYYQKVLENTKYQRPKQSSNKIRILQTKFEFGKKTNLTSLIMHLYGTFKPQKCEKWYCFHGWAICCRACGIIPSCFWLLSFWVTGMIVRHVLSVLSSNEVDLLRYST